MKSSRIKVVLGVSFVVLLVNTAYVWAFASPTIFYMTNVVVHLALGIAVSIAGAVVIAREPALRRPLGLAAPAMAVALGFGIFLTIWGNVNDHRWALRAHIVAGLVAMVAVLPYALRQRAQGVQGTRSGGAQAFGYGASVAALLVLVFPLGVRQYYKAYPNPHHRIVNPLTAPLSMEGEGGGPTSPFFPSSAKTNVGGIIPSNFFMDSETCGECHADIYKQWNSSAHHFASFNNQF